MPDRLRDLIDLVVDSLDEPGADGTALARAASFSRDHLDRLVSAATGESPVALRRRLLLERAAWQLRTGAATPTDAATAAGYGSLAAFSRSFKRAYGVPPTGLPPDAPVELPAPNGIHFHPPAGLLLPGRGDAGPGGRDLTERMVLHHLARTRELLEAAATLDPEALRRPLRPGFVAVWFEGEEADAATMAERLVFTLEVWVAAMAGLPQPAPHGPLLRRFDEAARGFERLAPRDPRPRRLGRRVRRRPLRAAAVVHLRRRPVPRPRLRRGAPRDARERAGGARRRRAVDRRPDPVGVGSVAPAHRPREGVRPATRPRPAPAPAAARASRAR